jgi:hypothetical protein
MLSSSKTDHKLVLILDVQSSIIRTSLLVVGDEIPKVIFTHSVETKSSDVRDDGALIQSSLKAIHDCVQACMRFVHHGENFAQYSHLKKKIDSVHYILSSPWIVSEAKMISKQFEKDTSISEKYVYDLIDEDREKILKSGQGLEVIEQKIFDVRLNSYPVTVWKNKPAKTLDVSFTVSVASSKMVAFFIEEFKHIVHHSKINFHSSLLLQYIGIEKVLEPGQNYCLIHVHGNETDASIILKKSCIFFGSFSFGVKDFVQKLAKETTNAYQAADSLLSLYVGNKLDSGLNETNIQAIQKIANEWLMELKKTLAKQKFDIKPPMSVIVTASLHDDCFVKVIRDSFPGVNVYVLTVDDLLTRVTFDRFAERGRLVALYSIAIHSLL